jgi:hypothetical protein
MADGPGKPFLQHPVCYQLLTYASRKQTATGSASRAAYRLQVGFLMYCCTKLDERRIVRAIDGLSETPETDTIRQLVTSTSLRLRDSGNCSHATESAKIIRL